MTYCLLCSTPFEVAPIATTGLSPQHVLMGRQMSTVTSPPNDTTQNYPAWKDEFMTGNVKKLTEILRSIMFRCWTGSPNCQRNHVSLFKKVIFTNKTSGKSVLVSEVERSIPGFAED